MFRMQDEISMGFDRLIAMASEVDKRRKSAENSPVQVTIKTLLTCMQSFFWRIIGDLSRMGLHHAKLLQT